MESLFMSGQSMVCGSGIALSIAVAMLEDISERAGLNE
jgi:hypothetical protein